MTVVAQLAAIFTFGLVVTGVVFLGVVRAKEVAERAQKVSRSGEGPGA